MNYKTKSGVYYEELDPKIHNPEFEERLLYSREGELHVIEYLKTNYPQLDWYSCKEICEKQGRLWSNREDTRQGDIIGCLKGAMRQIVNFDVKRSRNCELPTITYYGQASDEFDSTPFAFYLCAFNNLENENYKLVSGQDLFNEKRIKTKISEYYPRDVSYRHAMPIKECMEIILERINNPYKFSREYIESLYDKLFATKAIK